MDDDEHTLLGLNEAWHGTANGYNQHGCRCDRCRAAKAKLARKSGSNRRIDNPGRATQKAAHVINAERAGELTAAAAAVADMLDSKPVGLDEGDLSLLARLRMVLDV